MVDELNHTTLAVEQTLHGYSDGHRLIAGTAKLPTADARSMLILSDASGPGIDQIPDGYLTGYPLQGSGKYVLARTWGAPEMPRPGCVWTHSLLIDFADLATLTSADGLLSLFRRPDKARQGYDRRLLVQSGSRHSVSGPDRAGGLLNALYLHPLKRVEMQRGRAADDEQLILGVWFQQWPRLRRAFRFCTWAGIDRTHSIESFDLQMVLVRPRTQRVSSLSIVTAENAPVRLQLYAALEDLLHPSSDGLAAFLRKVGGDVSSGRSGMVPLCRLYDFLNSPSLDDTSLSAALEAVESLGAGQGSAARGIVFEKALEKVELLSEKSFGFVLSGIADQKPELDAATVGRIGNVLWRKSPRQFCSALEDLGPVGNIARAAIANMEPPLLVAGIARDPIIGRHCALQRPDLFLEPTFWNVPGLETSSIVGLLDAEAPNGHHILALIIAAGHGDVADAVVSRFGAEMVGKAIAAVDKSKLVEDFSIWIRAIVKQGSVLSGLLSSGVLTRRIVIELSKAMEPDDLINNVGEDPWAIASELEGRVESLDEVQFAGFLLARALGRRSRSCAKLFVASFDRAHKAIAMGQMPNTTWRQIERNLSWVYPWMEWDRCGRIREDVVRKFVDLELDPTAFGRLTADGTLFAELANLASKSGRGRRFLDLVHKAIRNYPENLM